MVKKYTTTKPTVELKPNGITTTVKPKPTTKPTQTEQEKLAELLKDQWWRLNNLYYILDVHGDKVKFKLNWAQEHLYRNLHYFNVVLKARQLGFSTFVDIYLLDCSLFNNNHKSGIIAHTRDDAEDLFKNKVRFAYDNLPKWLRETLDATSESARKLEFSNGSSIVVGTSLRGGTFQKLHVSEYGKIAARYPEKAREIKTGALNTVHIGQQIFIESTAEGASGEFYELCQRALRLRLEGVRLTALDPKIHFYSWMLHPSYTLPNDIDVVSITEEMGDYFNKLPVKLSGGQKAWYVKKLEQQGEDMKREFPSTPTEAFEQSMVGAIYGREMAMVRKNGQITEVSYNPAYPVYTWWDLGKGGSDYTAIWFMQEYGGRICMIDYHQGHNEGWREYLTLFNEKGYVFGEHYLPWDGNMAIAGVKKISSAREHLFDLGIRPIHCVPQTKSVWEDIKGNCKALLPRVWFDKVKCAEGIKCLDNYRREWDEKLGGFKDKPHHGPESHGADGFRTFAMGFTGSTGVLALDDDLNYTGSVYADTDEDYI